MGNKLLKNIGLFFLFGIAGITIDLDHLDNYLQHGIPISSETMTRTYHTIILVVVSYLFLYLVIRYYNFYLENKVET